jgi:hypothetical protein
MCSSAAIIRMTWAIPEPVGSLRATGIDNEQVTPIAGGNACKLLRIGI